MDPVTIIAVTCNAIQLAEVGIKVLSKSKEVYTSMSGTLAENSVLETVTDDLQRLTIKVTSTIDSGDVPTVYTEDDLATLELCEACASSSQELLDALDKLKMKGDFTRWRCLRKAVKSMWTKEKVNAMEAKLSSLRNQLNTRILVKLRNAVNLAS